MIKVNAQEHTKLLIRTNGIATAIKIAERSAYYSRKEAENDLPAPSKGESIYFPMDRKNGATKAIRARQKTNAFWNEVIGLLRKQDKRS